MVQVEKELGGVEGGVEFLTRTHTHTLTSHITLHTNSGGERREFRVRKFFSITVFPEWEGEGREWD